jgi:hypothetical protein
MISFEFPGKEPDGSKILRCTATDLKSITGDECLSGTESELEKKTELDRNPKLIGIDSD